MDEMDYVRILRDLREDADKTQTQIAEVLGTSQTMYARYERGANELPIHHLITLSKYYGVSTDYLLGLKKERSSADRSPVRVFFCAETAPGLLAGGCLEFCHLWGTCQMWSAYSATARSAAKMPLRAMLWRLMRFHFSWSA